MSNYQPFFPPSPDSWRSHDLPFYHETAPGVETSELSFSLLNRFSALRSRPESHLSPSLASLRSIRVLPLELCAKEPGSDLWNRHAPFKSFFFRNLYTRPKSSVPDHFFPGPSRPFFSSSVTPFFQKVLFFSRGFCGPMSHLAPLPVSRIEMSCHLRLDSSFFLIHACHFVPRFPIWFMACVKR